MRLPALLLACFPALAQDPAAFVGKWRGELDTFGVEESEGVSLRFRVEDGVATALVIVQAGQSVVAERLEE